MTRTSKKPRDSESKHKALVRWAVEFYDGDCLFVELGRAERNRLDQDLRRILKRLGVIFDRR